MLVGNRSVGGRWGQTETRFLTFWLDRDLGAGHDTTILTQGLDQDAGSRSLACRRGTMVRGTGAGH